MAWRAKIEGLTVACDSFLEILHLSQLLIADENSDGEVIEGYGAVGMAWRAKIKSSTVPCNSILDILDLSQPLKAGANSDGEDIE